MSWNFGHLNDSGMPSEKLTRILKARSPFSSEQIEALTDAEGWDWVYAHASPGKEKLPEICFTGFSLMKKAELAERARNVLFRVVVTITKTLSFLCVGENAGPVKVEKAKEHKVTILTRVQFNNLLETCELPMQ